MSKAVITYAISDLWWMIADAYNNSVVTVGRFHAGKNYERIKIAIDEIEMNNNVFYYIVENYEDFYIENEILEEITTKMQMNGLIGPKTAKRWSDPNNISESIRSMVANGYIGIIFDYHNCE